MAGSVVPPSDRRRAPAPGPQGTVPRMADLRHVWVRTEDLQIIRADQIVSLAIIGHHGRAESAGGPHGRGMLRLSADVTGGQEGDSITRVGLIAVDPAEAAAVLGALASAITAAAAMVDDGPVTACVFVWPDRTSEATSGGCPARGYQTGPREVTPGWSAACKPGGCAPRWAHVVACTSASCSRDAGRRP